MKNKKILELNKINYHITNLLGTNEVNVLEDVSGHINEGQITGIIGKSGAGKSCLLRIISGLIEQNSGQVKFRDLEVKTSMVFQDFALFPWLNVQENIELGLRSFHLSEAEIKERASEMIELIGLDGFEDSYPKELSGGMKQRVGFGRALVSEPDILLLDEPFSSLDILTAESLRSDFLELWQQKIISIKAAILVTHDVSDLLSVCDRVLFMEGKTGQFYNQMDVTLKHPRNADSSEYKKLSDEIYKSVFRDMKHNYALRKGHTVDYKVLSNICRVNIGMLIGFMEELNSDRYKGFANITKISEDIKIEIDDMGSCIEFAEALDFIKFKDSNIRITAFGRGFASTTGKNQKQIFAAKLRKYIGIISEFEELLKTESSNEKAIKKLQDRISKKLGKEKTQQAIDGLLNWVKFADII
ncbi:MAG: ATP-binding cassette domain-containing protein [Rickettsiales bacterium]